jgi:hypothetical protein
MIVVNIFPYVTREVGCGAGADNVVAGVPFGEARVGGMHVGGLHGGIAEVEEAFGRAVPFPDAPDDRCIGWVGTGDGVLDCGAAGSDGNGAGVYFEFLYCRFSIAHRRG